MKKKVLATIVMTAMMLSTNGITYAKLNEMGIVVNSKTVTLTDETGKPYIQDNRTMVPLRVVTENLGAKITWDNTAKSFEISKDDDVIKGFANKSTVTVNGVSKQIDNSPNVVVTQKGGRLYVPIRFVAENLDCTVDYKNRTVYITTNGTVVEVPIYPTMQPLDKSYSDFNNPVEALKYVAKETDWKLSQNAMGTQVKTPTTMLLIGTDDDNVAEFTIREWNKTTSEKIEEDRQRAEQTMSQVKEMLNFYLGDKDGIELYNAVDYAINNQKKFTATADNGMKITCNANSAGFSIVIK